MHHPIIESWMVAEFISLSGAVLVPAQPVRVFRELFTQNKGETLQPC